MTLKHSKHPMQKQMQVVPVAVDDLHAEFLAMCREFVFSLLVLGLREDVRVEIEDDGTDVVSEHPLEHGRGTRRAATVKNDCFHGG